MGRAHTDDMVEVHNDKQEGHNLMMSGCGTLMMMVGHTVMCTARKIGNTHLH